MSVVGRDASDERGAVSPLLPGLIGGAILAGVYALIRRRDRRDPLSERPDVPHSLHEDVGLPPADPGRRGWWEWR